MFPLEDQSHTTWAQTEFQTLSLGDKRLDNRLISCAFDFLAYPQSSINCACDDWASTKAAYRLFDNEKLTSEKILALTRAKPF